MKNRAWAVIGPTGAVILETIRRTRQDAIKTMEAWCDWYAPPVSWRRLHNDGFRVARVTVAQDGGALT